MEWWEQAAIILGMFILRLGVPLAITMLVGYWLRRLDTRWQAEAEARRQEVEALQKASAEPATKMIKVIAQPCWVMKDCPEAVRLRCPAYQQPQLPCWLARCEAEGEIPAACYHCKLLISGLVMKQR